MTNYCQCGCGEEVEEFSKHRKNIRKKFKHGHNTTWLPPVNHGKDHYNWKGGVYRHYSGYIWIYNPEHPHTNKNNYVPEHRLVMEKHIGRYLKPSEQVHHINRKRDDNRIENLKLCEDDAEHKEQHALLRRAEIMKRVCNDCGSDKTMYCGWYQWSRDKLKEGWLCHKCKRKQHKWLTGR